MKEIYDGEMLHGDTVYRMCTKGRGCMELKDKLLLPQEWNKCWVTMTMDGSTNRKTNRNISFYRIECVYITK